MGMWLLFDGGFVSIVAHRENKALLCVRGRVRGDVEAFCKRSVIADPKGVIETLDADYRFRVVLDRGIVTAAVAEIVASMDYDNFKTRVAKSQGIARANVYHDVWADLLTLDARHEKR
jgi:hypothetical protein